MKIKYLLPLGIWCALLFWGCGKKPPALPEESWSDTTYTPQDESFDPLSLRDEDVLKLPESKLKPYPRESLSLKSSDKSGKGKGVKESAGFRVQLIASDAEGEARSLEQQAMLDFKESVYLIFDPPNYKVRLGDCPTRAEANALRDRALKLGYDNAWVVPCRVMLPDHP